LVKTVVVVVTQQLAYIGAKLAIDILGVGESVVARGPRLVLVIIILVVTLIAVVSIPMRGGMRGCR